MRFVIKKDSDKTVKLASNNTYLELLNIARNIDKSKIDDNIYRDSYKTIDEIRSRVEDQLAISYLNKCGYCERITKADIEHYRPKKGVHNEIHDGYYWLCYEWTNLLPSCVKCNRDGGKGNYFPILGTRLNAPIFLLNKELDLDSSKANSYPLKNEKPYLLHPEIDHPESFFEFILDPNGEGIRIQGIDKDKRGDKTIEICKLNRQELRLDRTESVIDPFVEAIDESFGRLERNEIEEIEFQREINQTISTLINQSTFEKKSHTYLRKFITKDFTNFQEIVLPYFLIKQRSIVASAFKNFNLI